MLRFRYVTWMKGEKEYREIPAIMLYDEDQKSITESARRNIQLRIVHRKAMALYIRIEARSEEMRDLDYIWQWIDELASLREPEYFDDMELARCYMRALREFAKNLNEIAPLESVIERMEKLRNDGFENDKMITYYLADGYIFLAGVHSGFFKGAALRLEELLNNGFKDDVRINEKLAYEMYRQAMNLDEDEEANDDTNKFDLQKAISFFEHSLDGVLQGKVGLARMLVSLYNVQNIKDNEHAQPLLDKINSLRNKGFEKDPILGAFADIQIIRLLKNNDELRVQLNHIEGIRKRLHSIAKNESGIFFVEHAIVRAIDEVVDVLDADGIEICISELEKLFSEDPTDRALANSLTGAIEAWAKKQSDAKNINKSIARIKDVIRKVNNGQKRPSLQMHRNLAWTYSYLAIAQNITNAKNTIRKIEKLIKLYWDENNSSRFIAEALLYALCSIAGKQLTPAECIETLKTMEVQRIKYHLSNSRIVVENIVRILTSAARTGNEEICEYVSDYIQFLWESVDDADFEVIQLFAKFLYDLTEESFERISRDDVLKRMEVAFIKVHDMKTWTLFLITSYVRAFSRSSEQKRSIAETLMQLREKDTYEFEGEQYPLPVILELKRDDNAELRLVAITPPKDEHETIDDIIEKIDETGRRLHEPKNSEEKSPSTNTNQFDDRGEK